MRHNVSSVAKLRACVTRNVDKPVDVSGWHFASTCSWCAAAQLRAVCFDHHAKRTVQACLLLSAGKHGEVDGGIVRRICANLLRVLEQRLPCQMDANGYSGCRYNWVHWKNKVSALEIQPLCRAAGRRTSLRHPFLKLLLVWLLTYTQEASGYSEISRLVLWTIVFSFHGISFCSEMEKVTHNQSLWSCSDQSDVHLTATGDMSCWEKLRRYCSGFAWTQLLMTARGSPFFKHLKK